MSTLCPSLFPPISLSKVLGVPSAGGMTCIRGLASALTAASKNAYIYSNVMNNSLRANIKLSAFILFLWLASSISSCKTILVENENISYSDTLYDYPAWSTSIIYKGRISVVGRAESTKPYAMIISKKGVYYIDGLYDWPDKMEDKRVRVKGLLFERTTTLKDSSVIPQYIPQFYLIRSARISRSL